MIYRRAEQVEFIARTMMGENDPHEHLKNVPLVYLFMNKVPLTKGREVWGRAVKLTGRNAHLAPVRWPGTDAKAKEFFVIEVAEPIWEVSTPEQRIALVDHELSHCGVGEKGLALYPHDVEEFAGVVARRGLWRKDLEKLVTIGAAYAEQLTFKIDHSMGEVTEDEEGGESDEPPTIEASDVFDDETIDEEGIGGLTAVLKKIKDGGAEISIDLAASGVG